MVAYTGDYDGNDDVYVVPATGGEPRRLTYHPGTDVAVGWTPTARAFCSAPRAAVIRVLRGSSPFRWKAGFPREFPCPWEWRARTPPTERNRLRAALESAPGRSRLPTSPSSIIAAGMTAPIWIANLADSSIVKIPRENSNDFNPMWIGDRIYFLSDRNGPVDAVCLRHQNQRSEGAVQERRLRSQVRLGGAGRDRLRAVRLDSHLRSATPARRRSVEVTRGGRHAASPPAFRESGQAAS